MMPKFEVRGPDPDGDWFVVRIETITGVTSEMALDEVYASEAAAQAAAERFNAEPSCKS